MEVILAILGSSALAAIISGVFALLQNKQKTNFKSVEELQATQDILREGLQWVMYDRIKYLCKEHITRGYIASNDLEDLERMHKVYHDKLKGNGFLDDLMKVVHSLKIIPARIYMNEEEINNG